MTTPPPQARTRPVRPTEPQLRAIRPMRQADAWHARPTRARRSANACPTHLRHSTRAALALTLAALAVTTPLGWGSVHAAFTAAVAGGSNSWSTGTVTFGANNPATALFTVSNAKPGSTGSACITVTYTGSLPARVRLYVASGGLTGTGLGNHLAFQINEGTGGNADCTDFVQSANDYNTTGLSDHTKTLTAFATSSTDHATGVSTWNNVTNGATKTYQFRYLLKPDNAAIGTTVNATFTWEAQS